MILYLIIFITFILFIFLIKNNEQFTNNEYNDLFSLKIFDNKEIFLIANNSKLSTKTKRFLNNINYKNSIIVRFNGYKPIIKDFVKGKTDIMIYRAADTFFHGYNKKTYNKNIINVFTYSDKKKKNKYDLINNLDIKDKIYTLKSKHINKITNNNIDKSLTSGFSFLLDLIEKVNYKKIYLIGFTFHNKKISSSHDQILESNYFEKNIKKNNKIKILL